VRPPDRVMVLRPDASDAGSAGLFGALLFAQLGLTPQVPAAGDGTQQGAGTDAADAPSEPLSRQAAQFHRQSRR
jgi:hypothetical protein